MKMTEIKDLTDKNLLEKVKEEELNLTKMKLAHVVSPLENPMRIRDTRKTIARLETELRRRKVASSQATNTK